jgi:hypothetical protein
VARVSIWAVLQGKKTKIRIIFILQLSNQTGLLTVNSQLGRMGGRASCVDGFASIVSAMLEL